MFQTADARRRSGYDHALRVLAGNVQRLPNYKDPVLIEGAVYAGIWQECGPLEFSHQDPGGYSPAALAMVDFTWRLAGVVEQAGEVHWNVRPGHPASQGASFRMRSDTGASFELRYAAEGAQLQRNGREVARLGGGTARVLTDTRGTPAALLGVHAEAQAVTLHHGRHKRTVTVHANQRVPLSW